MRKKAGEREGREKGKRRDGREEKLERAEREQRMTREERRGGGSKRLDWETGRSSSSMLTIHTE